MSDEYGGFVMQVFGGLNHTFENRALTALNNQIIEWNSFLAINGFDKTPNDIDADYDKVAKKILEIIGMPNNNQLKALLPEILYSYYHKDPRFHIMFRLRKNIAYESLSAACYNLFNVIRIYIEKLIKIFLNLRNEYVKYIKKGDKINIKKYIEKSKKIYKDSTSPIISNVKSLKITVDNKFDKLQRLLYSYEYVGFCPKVPTKRVLLLLEFPIEQLSNEIEYLDRFLGVDSKLPLQKDIISVINEFKINYKPPTKLPYIEREGIKINNKARTKTILDLSYAIIRYIKQFKPSIKLYGTYYNNLAKLINKFANKLNKVLKIA